MKNVIVCLIAMSFASAAHAGVGHRAADEALSKVCRGLEQSIEEATDAADHFTAESEDSRAASFAKISEELSDKYAKLSCDKRIAKEKQNRAEDVQKCQAIVDAASQLSDEGEAKGNVEAELKAKTARTVLKSKALVCQAVLNRDGN